MKKMSLILLFCCSSTKILSSHPDDGSWFLMTIVFGSFCVVTHEISNIIDYWTKVPDPICIYCNDPCKQHANRLAKLPCGHYICCLCKQVKVDGANLHNAKLENIRYENLIYPVCSCGVKFDFDDKEQYASYKNEQIIRQTIRPFVSTLPIRKCSVGCGNRSFHVLDCGHGICQSCLASNISQSIKVSGKYAKICCPSCKCSMPIDKFQYLIKI